MDKRSFIRSGVAATACMFCSRAGLLPAFALGPTGDAGEIPPELWKWSHEACHYRKIETGVECTNCPNGCKLKRKETSKCRNRINIGDKLYSIAYGNPCALHVDPIEKKPFFHFLPSTYAYSLATAGCNLACLNCQNWEISQKSPRETRNYDLFPAHAVSECLNNECRSIAYTYSEPTTFYEYVHDTAAIARSKGIKNVYKSNGYINEKPLRQLCKYLDAANIDLKGFSESTYLKLNSGKLAPVLRSLQVLREEGVWLEITNLVVPTWNDDPVKIREMCKWLMTNGMQDVPLHFSRFSPMHKLTQLPVTPLDILVKARIIALDAGLHYVYIGNVPGTSFENTYCPKCKALLIERKGFRIVTNQLINGACNHCKTAIPGIWS